MITCSLTRPEDEALTEALISYFDSIEMELKNRSDHQLHLIDLLKEDLLTFYCSSPDINRDIKQFEYSKENITHVLKPDRNGEKKRVCPPHKARFLVWALEYKGFYQRPKHQSRDSLYDSFVSFIYKDKPEGYQIEDYQQLEGIYLVKRLSFNNSFPGYVTVSKMWLWFDQEKKILRYQTINHYSQIVNGETLERERVTKGYVFKFQGNILFLGDVDYTHLLESEKKTSHYPEIFLAHAHGGDQKNIRGIILGNYPFLNLPVATSILISKESTTGKESVEKNLKGYDSSNDPEIGLKEMSELKGQERFIINSLEEKYSKMLTP